MDVVPADFEVARIADAVVGEASLPDGYLRCKAVGEAAFDDPDCSFYGFAWGQKQVNMVEHHDEGVELVVAFGPVVVKVMKKVPDCDALGGIAIPQL